LFVPEREVGVFLVLILVVIQLVVVQVLVLIIVFVIELEPVLVFLPILVEFATHIEGLQRCLPGEHDVLHPVRVEGLRWLPAWTYDAFSTRAAWRAVRRRSTAASSRLRSRMV